MISSPKTSASPVFAPLVASFDTPPQPLEVPPPMYAKPQMAHSIRCAVLVHGCHLQANQWERIVWGEPPNLLGRFPKAVLVAWEQEAELVIFGTGASIKDGQKEGEYTLNFGLAQWTKLADFSVFKQYTSMQLEQLRRWFLERVLLELESQNTVQEVTNALKICQQRGLNQILQLSSPTHISRCIRDALKVSDAMREEEKKKKYPWHGGKDAPPDSLSMLLSRVYATTSDTCYANCTIGDVVIVEPPHRGDRQVRREKKGGNG
jgi:hypothetical protein